MRWADIGDLTCSVARTLSVVGDRWTLLVLRDAFLGVRRFEDFQAVGLTRHRLADRLKRLVDAEVMLGHLARAGHAIVPDGEARVVVVNTCGFIDRAKEESVDAILEQVERKKRGEIDRIGLRAP